MSDVDVRRARQRFNNDPNKETLVAYLQTMQRHGMLDDATLIEHLRIWPYDETVWPWYSQLRGDRTGDPYNPNLHNDLLLLISRIRPRHLLLEILETWHRPKDLVEILNVIYRELVERQAYDIVENHIDFEEGDSGGWDYEDMVSLARGYPLAHVPQAIWMDWDSPWKVSKWGSYPDDLDAIVTVIMEGDYAQPETVTSAFRCRVGLDLEPSPGCWWEYNWLQSPEGGYWRQSQYRHRGSSTLLPYREYCDIHKQDLIDCPACPACGAENHRCECELCDECGGYTYGWNSVESNFEKDQVISPEKRCHCRCENWRYEHVCMWPDNKCTD